MLSRELRLNKYSLEIEALSNYHIIKLSNYPYVPIGMLYECGSFKVKPGRLK